MIEQALFAYLHFLSIFVTVSLLVSEFILYRPQMTPIEVKRMTVIDLLYGVSSLIVVGTGFSRALWFAKGWDFYKSNSLFWLKVAIASLWALLSIPPTLHFLKLRKHALTGTIPLIPTSEYRRIRRLIWVQFLLIPWIPLLAVFMARGFGVA